MCNHYQSKPELLDNLPEWREYANSLAGAKVELPHDVWPRRHGLVARKVMGRAILDPMIWGVPLSLPGKRPGTTITKHVTNVRNLTSPFWKSMLAMPAQRCLVPFTSFAEPKLSAGREEHWFAVNHAPLSAFAGIWRATDAGNVFAFLTCEPNPLVAPLHPKAMPVILHPGDYDRWLEADYAEVCALAAPFPSQLMSVE